MRLPTHAVHRILFACTTCGFVSVIFASTAVASDTSPAPDVATRKALERALDDEWHAEAFYQAVMARFGECRPFSNIVHAEQRHAAVLLQQFDRFQLTPPVNRWPDQTLNVPDSFAEACDAAELAEILNADLYDDLIASVSDKTLITVFERLRDASKDRHLPAFRRHSNGWHAISEDALSPTQKKQLARANVAKAELMNQLITRLLAAIEEAGPANAIDVCKREAPVMAEKVSKAHELRIGRTSPKLRNPTNTGPPWVGYLASDRPIEPRYIAARNGNLGVTFPILTGATCLNCHGPEQQIEPIVRKQLREKYPHDQALGFKEGDLRGWFWIEVPPIER